MGDSNHEKLNSWDEEGVGQGSPESTEVLLGRKRWGLPLRLSEQA